MQGARTSARRNNGSIQAAPPIAPSAVPAQAAGAARPLHAGPAGARRALGGLALLGILSCVLLVTAGAATAPSRYVPGRSGGWPSWLSGPLSDLGVGITTTSFQILMLVMCASYMLVLLVAREISTRALLGAIVTAHVILLLGPPLLSQDVFGYLGFARLGALHGLDPYTHVAAEAPTDPVFPFVGWPFKLSPYGPLFTLASYATAPLGLAGGLWALKALAVASSLGAVALLMRAAEHLGRSPRWVAAFVGLNPVLLVLAVGGAHNDTLILLALAAALALTAGSSARFRGGVGALVAAVGVKVTAGLVLPFLLLGSSARARPRLRVVASAVLSLAVLAGVGLIGFGTHALGFLSAVGEQQQLVATHSVPAETARLVGLSGTPGWWRQLFILGFALALALALWRTARGSNWRVTAGWATLALLVSTAWLLPWYAIWVLPLAAVSGDRRLCAATLVFCAYAVLIHLPLANPLLSPPRVASHRQLLPLGAGNRVDLSGLQVPGNVALDLRW